MRPSAALGRSFNLRFAQCVLSNIYYTYFASLCCIETKLKHKNPLQRVKRDVREVRGARRRATFAHGVTCRATPSLLTAIPRTAVVITLPTVATATRAIFRGRQSQVLRAASFFGFESLWRSCRWCRWYLVAGRRSVCGISVLVNREFTGVRCSRLHWYNPAVIFFLLRCKHTHRLPHRCGEDQ